MDKKSFSWNTATRTNAVKNDSKKTEKSGEENRYLNFNTFELRGLMTTFMYIVGDGPFDVTLNPMQIRTFIIQVAYK